MTTEQLWSDERIVNEVDDAMWEADSELRERARRLLRRCVADAETELARLRGELAAARQWQPVEDGLFYIEGDDNYLTASLGGSLLSIIRSDLDEPDMDEESDTHSIQLDPNKYRLCCLVPPADAGGEVQP